MKRLILLGASGILTAVPSAALAQRTTRIDSQTRYDTLGRIVEEVFQILIVFIPAIAILFVAFSGYRYMIAQGNPELIDKAKKSLTYSVFGLIVALASVLVIWTIAQQFGFRTNFNI